jgi:cation transport protein ChaC
MFYHAAMVSNDPFRHHPELRATIKPWESSYFREMDLAAIDARAAAQGRPEGWRTPCEVREAERLSWLEGHWEEDLWVFAYGSLMWDPAMDFAEVRHAWVDGFRRSFCLWDEGGRGTPQVPGLMLALDRGGSCEGLTFRIEADKLDHETFILFRREMIARAYLPEWLELQTASGPVRALGFTANHENERIKPDLPLDLQTSMIARAEGHLGTNFAYLSDTRRKLGVLGIEDPYIAGLYDRVSEARERGASE